MNRFHRWPPLNCLRGFEAAARLNSFSRAARELHMTQSAISHQIKTLEAYLEQPLFIRDKRKVVLSDAGADLLYTTEQCLELFARGLQRLEHFKKPNQLIVHTGSAFASNWLVARLDRYRALHAAADVWLYTTDMEPDLELAEVHLAILHGSGDWPELSSRLLLPDLLVPLCAPSHPVMQANGEPAVLLEHSLLHGEQQEDWHRWFARSGMNQANPTSGPNFSNPALMLQAAERGQGIALASLVLAADAIDAGRLASPVRLAVRSELGYYLVTREDGLKSKNVAPFTDWLVAETDDFATGLYRQIESRYVKA